MEQDRFELLEDYLNDKLDPKKKDEVERLLKEDASLATALETVRNATDIVKQHAMLDAIDEIHEQHLSETSKKKSNIPVWAYAAAASVVLVLSYLLFTVDVNSTNPPDLFTKYFEVYPDYLSERSGSAETNWLKAFDAYNEENFELAAQLFALGSTQERTEDIQFYLALSLLSSEKSFDAIPLFQGLLIEKSKYEQQARWYLALAFIHEKEYSAAIKVLQNIGEEEYNHTQAQEVLKEIGKDQKSK